MRISEKVARWGSAVLQSERRKRLEARMSNVKVQNPNPKVKVKVEVKDGDYRLEVRGKETANTVMKTGAVYWMRIAVATFVLLMV